MTLTYSNADPRDFDWSHRRETDTRSFCLKQGNSKLKAEEAWGELQEN